MKETLYINLVVDKDHLDVAPEIISRKASIELFEEVLNRILNEGPVKIEFSSQLEDLTEHPIDKTERPYLRCLVTCTLEKLNTSSDDITHH